LYGAILAAQTPPLTHFEVASLKPVTPIRQGVPSRRIIGGPGTSHPDQIEYREQSLRDLILMAYRVQPFQLTTLAWMDGEYFDIVAKVSCRSDCR